jgi:hypothetical protein
MDKPTNLNEYYTLYLEHRSKFEAVKNANADMDEIEAALSQTTPAELESWGLKADADGTLADVTTKFNTLLGQVATLGLQAAV